MSGGPPRPYNAFPIARQPRGEQEEGDGEQHRLSIRLPARFGATHPNNRLYDPGAVPNKRSLAISSNSTSNEADTNDSGDSGPSSKRSRTENASENGISTRTRRRSPSPIPPDSAFHTPYLSSRSHPSIHMMISLAQLVSGTSLLQRLELAQRTMRWQAVDLSLLRQFPLPGGRSAGMVSLDIESGDSRYLLGGGGDGGIRLWDLEDFEDPLPQNGRGGSRSNDAIPPRKTFKLIAQAERNVAHKSSVSSLQWYPIDSGLFVTGSADHTVKVWDPNAMRQVIAWDLESPVHCIAMSQAMSAKGHSMVAVGSALPQIRLCDLRTTSSAHTLIGHRPTPGSSSSAGVLAVDWHPTNEYLLASGSRDKTIRLWDVRRAQSCVCVLDKDNREDPTSAPLDMTSSAPVQSHQASVTCLRFLHPNGTHLLSTSSDNRPRIWSIDPARPAKTRNTHLNFGPHINLDSRPVGASIVPSSQCSPPLVLIPGSEDGEILAFDLLFSSPGPRLRARLRAHLGRCNAVRARPGYEELYSAGADGTVLCWSFMGDRREIEAIEDEREEERRRAEGYFADREQEENGLVVAEAGGPRRIEDLYKDSWSDDD